MIFGKTKLELKVGVFVFIGVVLLSFSVLSIGKVKHWTSGYKVRFGFNFVNGVKMGAPVRFAGVDQGEVKGIKLVFFPQEQKTRAYVECWIKNNISIPVDSTVWVNTLGLLGEKYIEIIPGKDYKNCLAPGDTMMGIDPIPMHEVSRQAMNIVASLEKLVGAINTQEGTIGKFVYDPALYNNLEALTDDIKKNPWKLFHRGKNK